jgi:cytochrome c oxidase subunit IV
MSAGHEDIHHHVRAYIGVFVALMVLTIITVGISYMHLAVALAVTVALVVATIKGSMVAAYFMHLKSERPAIFWILLLTVIFWVHLMFIPVLMYLDHFGTNVVVR